MGSSSCKKIHTHFPGGASPSIPSLAVVQGTVIDLVVTDPRTGGGVGTGTTERASRPLVAMTPRRFTSGGTLTVNVYSNYALTTARMQINGSPFNLAPYGPIGAPPMQTWSIPMNNLPAQPITIIMQAQESVPPGAGLTAAVGMNELRL